VVVLERIVEELCCRRGLSPREAAEFVWLHVQGGMSGVSLATAGPAPAGHSKPDPDPLSASGGLSPLGPDAAPGASLPGVVPAAQDAVVPRSAAGTSEGAHDPVEVILDAPDALRDAVRVAGRLRDAAWTRPSSRVELDVPRSVEASARLGVTQFVLRRARVRATELVILRDATATSEPWLTEVEKLARLAEQTGAFVSVRQHALDLSTSQVRLLDAVGERRLDVGEAGLRLMAPGASDRLVLFVSDGLEAAVVDGRLGRFFATEVPAARIAWVHLWEQSRWPRSGWGDLPRAGRRTSARGLTLPVAPLSATGFGAIARWSQGQLSPGLSTVVLPTDEDLWPEASTPSPSTDWALRLPNLLRRLSPPARQLLVLAATVPGDVDLALLRALGEAFIGGLRNFELAEAVGSGLFERRPDVSTGRRVVLRLVSDELRHQLLTHSPCGWLEQVWHQLARMAERGRAGSGLGIPFKLLRRAVNGEAAVCDAEEAPLAGVSVLRELLPNAISGPVPVPVRQPLRICLWGPDAEVNAFARLVTGEAGWLTEKRHRRKPDLEALGIEWALVPEFVPPSQSDFSLDAADLHVVVEQDELYESDPERRIVEQLARAGQPTVVVVRAAGFGHGARGPTPDGASAFLMERQRKGRARLDLRNVGDVESVGLRRAASAVGTRLETFVEAVRKALEETGRAGWERPFVSARDAERRRFADRLLASWRDTGPMTDVPLQNAFRNLSHACDAVGVTPGGDEARRRFHDSWRLFSKELVRVVEQGAVADAAAKASLPRLEAAFRAAGLDWGPADAEVFHACAAESARRQPGLDGAFARWVHSLSVRAESVDELNFLRRLGASPEPLQLVWRLAAWMEKESAFAAVEPDHVLVAVLQFVALFRTENSNLKVALQGERTTRRPVAEVLRQVEAQGAALGAFAPRLLRLQLIRALCELKHALSDSAANGEPASPPVENERAQAVIEGLGEVYAPGRLRVRSPDAHPGEVLADLRATGCGEDFIGECLSEVHRIWGVRSIESWGSAAVLSLAAVAIERKRLAAARLDSEGWSEKGPPWPRKKWEAQKKLEQVRLVLNRVLACVDRDGRIEAGDAAMQTDLVWSATSLRAMRTVPPSADWGWGMGVLRRLTHGDILPTTLLRELLPILDPTTQPHLSWGDEGHRVEQVRRESLQIRVRAASDELYRRHPEQYGPPQKDAWPYSPGERKCGDWLKSIEQTRQRVEAFLKHAPPSPEANWDEPRRPPVALDPATGLLPGGDAATVPSQQADVLVSVTERVAVAGREVAELGALYRARPHNLTSFLVEARLEARQRLREAFGGGDEAHRLDDALVQQVEQFAEYLAESARDVREEAYWSQNGEAFVSKLAAIRLRLDAAIGVLAVDPDSAGGLKVRDNSS
jgi:hypothetical protein